MLIIKIHLQGGGGHKFSIPKSFENSEIILIFIIIELFKKKNF